MFNDIGKFVGIYFYVLACASIVSMLIGAIFFDSLYVDFTIILLLWAAPNLIRHKPAARRWTIRVCGFMLFILAVMSTVFAILGALDVGHSTFSLFGKTIEHPSPWLVAALLFATGVMIGLPLVLLLTRRAKLEFMPIVSS
jgi:hypothetical protein